MRLKIYFRFSCLCRDKRYAPKAAGNLSAYNPVILPNLYIWLPPSSAKNPPDSRPHPHPAAITALEKFIECGVARYGVVRFHGPECGRDMFVAFSCKRRGLCPSCDAKRSAIITTQALDAADAAA